MTLFTDLNRSSQRNQNNIILRIYRVRLTEEYAHPDWREFVWPGCRKQSVTSHDHALIDAVLWSTATISIGSGSLATGEREKCRKTQDGTGKKWRKQSRPFLSA